MRNLKICWVCLWITPGWAACSLSLCGLWQPGFLVRILPVHTHEAGVLGSSLIVPWPMAGFQDTNMEHGRGLASNSCLVTYWLHDFRWIISCLLGLASNTTSDDNTTCFWKVVVDDKQEDRDHGAARCGCSTSISPLLWDLEEWGSA